METQLPIYVLAVERPSEKRGNPHLRSARSTKVPLGLFDPAAMGDDELETPNTAIPKRLLDRAS